MTAPKPTPEQEAKAREVLMKVRNHPSLDPSAAAGIIAAALAEAAEQELIDEREALLREMKSLDLDALFDSAKPQASQDRTWSACMDIIRKRGER